MMIVIYDESICIYIYIYIDDDNDVDDENNSYMLY